MPFTMGVDMVERSNKTKATKKRSVKGVAGRSIVMVDVLNLSDDEVEVRGDIIIMSVFGVCLNECA